MGSLLADTWSKTIMLIENQWGCIGTGFLVTREIDEKNIKIFLVTNKHVLHRELERRKTAEYIILHCNIKNTNGSISSHEVGLKLESEEGYILWREHPERDVDVLAFDVTPIIVNQKNIVYKRISYDLICTNEILEHEDITIGDEVITIGYPVSQTEVRHRFTNDPFFRSGIIATRIGEQLEDTIRENNGERKRILRGFLIDGGFIPGSSGSPVILKPIIGRINRRDYKVKMETPQPYLLGIIAETNYSFIEGVYPSFAGLGLAFDAVTVIETIEEFFK